MYHKINRVRLSFPSIDRTEKFAGKDTGKYSVTFIFDPLVKSHVEELKSLNKAINDLAKEEFGKKKYISPLKKVEGGLESVNAGGEYWKVKATSKFEIECFNRKAERITFDRSQFYGGAVVSGIVTLVALEYEGIRRVSLYINSLQFIKHDEPLGGSGGSADKPGFEPVYDSDDFEDDGEEEGGGAGVDGYEDDIPF